MAEVEIEIYALVRYSKNKIDEARDNIQNTILDNFDTLRTYGLAYIEFNDEDTDTIELRDDVRINYGSLTIMFKKIN